ncbi:hypothetical protein ACFXKV_04515 [Streptomyces globisporus]|uniref:hypothetical protein n=1 Tax=Streptomyces globisporus TaxID=1908 RepID=UPI003624FD1A
MTTPASWSTPFRLLLADGRIWHGAEFASGFVCVHHPDEHNICTIAVSIDGLLDDARHPDHPLHSAQVERPNKSGCGPECSEMHTETGRCEIAQNRHRPVSSEEAS